MDTDNQLNSSVVFNTKYADYVKSLYNDEASLQNQINFLQYLASFMSKNVTSYFSDEFLEKKLNTISSQIDFDLSDQFQRNSVLHIMTKAYAVGGHTKLVEIMMKNLSSSFKKQSVLISDFSTEIPSTLKNRAEQYGEFILFKDINPIEKAQQLARNASEYEYVILHIHQDDILANLAFGNLNFNRPVLFMNHADHAFWCGVSISDLVLDLSQEGSHFTDTVRGAHLSKIVHIPIEQNNETFSKLSAREELSLPRDKQIILSIASEYKYGRTQKDVSGFINMAHNILNKVPDSIFILIGPSTENKFWAEAKTLSHNRIQPLGRINRELLAYYINASDLYIESFPFASYTAFLDTALYGINMLSLSTPTFTQDIVKANNLLSNSIPELESKAISLLTQNQQETQVIDISIHLHSKWTENFMIILKNHLPPAHEIHKIMTGKTTYAYLNHIVSIIGKDLILSKTYVQLPFILKIKLASALIKYNIASSQKEIRRLIRKTISF